MYGMEIERRRLIQTGLSEERLSEQSRVMFDHPQRKCIIGNGQCLEIGVLNGVQIHAQPL